MSAKNKSNEKKQDKKLFKNLKWKSVLFIGIPLILFASITAFLIYRNNNRSRLEFRWYVEEAYVEALQKSLTNGKIPEWMRNAKIEIYQDAQVLPQNICGAIITVNRLGAMRSLGGTAPLPPSVGTLPLSDDSDPVVTPYPRLARTREYEGALALALDPWFIFKKRSDPDLSRPRVINGPSADDTKALLLIPGRDQKSQRAWTARLLQEGPGQFPEDRAEWEKAKGEIFRNDRFQDGAFTYTWNDALFVLLGDEPSWIYAPLSRLRTLPTYRTNTIEASIFPEPSDTYSIQADILWAVPFGPDKSRRQKHVAAEWLKSPAMQSVIADSLTWLAAHPNCPPYNPAASTARIAWLTSAYVWEDPVL
jgi:hypothetical protein